MKKVNISSLNPAKFIKLVPSREQIIASSPATPIPHQDTYPANRIAKALHPDKQFVKIAKVEEFSADVKRYTFVPDTDKGTTSLAYFSAGQYLSVSLEIGKAVLTRPYSLSSCPADALDGFYQLTIKRVKDGLATNYILDNWKEGDSVEVSAPLGNFKYEPLRDAKTVVGLAGGSGITPFLSFARAIANGEEDMRLTLLYGSRTRDDVLFKDEFDQIAQSCDKVKVVYVLSADSAENCESGFLTADLITKYAPKDEPYSVFMCGPQAMYDFADGEIAKLGLKNKYVRHELFGEYHNPERNSDYVAPQKDTCTITVKIRDTKTTVGASVNDTILVSLEKNGIAVPAHCRSGECGWCHSKLVSGEVYVPASVDGRRMADFDYGYIHPCCTFPLGDVEIVVPTK
jgi:ferredoxin-NADP reductase